MNGPTGITEIVGNVSESNASGMYFQINIFYLLLINNFYFQVSYVGLQPLYEACQTHIIWVSDLLIFILNKLNKLFTIFIGVRQQLEPVAGSTITAINAGFSTIDVGKPCPVQLWSEQKDDEDDEEDWDKDVEKEKEKRIQKEIDKNGIDKNYQKDQTVQTDQKSSQQLHKLTADIQKDEDSPSNQADLNKLLVKLDDIGKQMSEKFPLLKEYMELRMKNW